MKITTDVKKQHTVPRFLLDKFGFGKKGKKRRLYTFDKKSSRRFQQSVFDATTRNTFYNIENHPERASLEPILGIYETEAAPLIKRIIETNSIGWLSEVDRFKIATFIAVQRSRSYGEFLRIEHVVGALTGKLAAIGSTREQIEEELGSEGSSERKNLFLELILDQRETVAHLMAKSWVLYETSTHDPFFISDNPVTLYNEVDMGFLGNLGVALKGIQIHLPLSSSLTLALTCPSISEAAINGKRQVKALIAIASPLLQQLNNPLGLIELGNAYESGNPIKQSANNVRFLNSLQVSFSEQYVFCEKDNFALAEEMIGDNKAYKSGLRMQIS
ncbi:DUF4238 domain-containing protein [Halomonas huangheensis]|uniref:DUF4238 domain-containing protein n=1 Tax=Halomonas huangheensis TaxID=1178482 RepID=W1NC85_9GAMM|nr:DUF4238 domain-containing protein [Halomonas huangheensis]ALM54078.1 hypothetical protein AR456_18705 [Halomonas huangheensis]ERL52535.1 hypothetical protein BJB45_08255 [Halomonas huangheensis]